MTSSVFRITAVLHCALGVDTGELEDHQNVNGGSNPRANTAAEVVSCGCQMEQRQERLRRAEGAGEVDLCNEEQGNEKWQRFFQIESVKREHWNSFQIDGDEAGA
jgi:hypothetical protein